jgi:hypothetical protein
MHTQVGFDLNYVKHYGSPEMAQQMVGKTLASYIEQGVVFNIQIVEQRRGGSRGWWLATGAGSSSAPS